MRQENFFRNKKILVAGGAGFIGSNVIEALLERGANIRATFHKNRPQITDSRITYIQEDLTTEDGCRRVVSGVEYVFMCAANTSGAVVIEKTPLVHVTPNVIMNARMLEASYEAGVKKYLWLSSNVVYPESDYPVKESEAFSGPPYEKYFAAAWMKRYGEILCEIYATKIKDPMNVVVVRPGNAYGEYDKFDLEKSHVIPALIKKAVRRQDPIEVWGDGNDVKDFIYVKDLVQGILGAMVYIEKFQPINIASGRPATVREALHSVLSAARYEDARIVFNSLGPTMIPKRFLDVSLARELFGFEAKTQLEKGIRRTVEWYKNNNSRTP